MEGFSRGRQNQTNDSSAPINQQKKLTESDIDRSISKNQSGMEEQEAVAQGGRDHPEARCKRLAA